MPDPTGGFAGVGCFGKLPGAGDFVQRRLPARFVERWDGAFEAAVDAARQTFGDDWPEAWRDAPVWRFAFAPGVIDAAAWVGVTGPSVDRVGRRFPMLLAAPLADAASVEPVLRAGGCWFDALERTHRAAQGDASMHAEAFDARVAALPGPLDALHGHASALPPLDWSAGGHWRLPLPQGGGEDGLAAWWTSFTAACGEACLWWTRGAARMPPSVLLTRGLPQPAAYAGFLDAAYARAPWQSQGTFGALPPAAPAVTQPAPAPLPDDLDDVLADLLAMPPAASSSLSMPSASSEAVSSPVARAAVPSLAAPAAAVPRAIGTAAGAMVIHRAADALTLVAADDGADDPRRHAAATIGTVVAALADGELVAGLRPLRDRLLDLHPRLHQRREDLIDPVAEDGAVIAARIAGGWAEVLRIGTAAAWHWRRGQLQPLFATGSPSPSSDDDTARPGDFGDLLFSRASPVAPGLGAAVAPSCDEVVCAVQPGDRLLLLATAVLAPLPPDVFSRALAMPSCDDARARIATAASLGTEPSRWPLAVIEVGT